MNIKSSAGVIVATTRKTNNSFFGKAKNDAKKQPVTKQQIKKDTADKELKYSVIGGLTVLGAIGLALINREQVLKIFGKEKNTLKRYLKPTMTERRISNTITGGPDIDLTGGPKAIHKAWSNYIKEIETNRKNNAEVFKRLKDAFSENSKQADKLESLAQKRVEQNGGIWA